MGISDDIKPGRLPHFSRLIDREFVEEKEQTPAESKSEVVAIKTSEEKNEHEVKDKDQVEIKDDQPKANDSDPALSIFGAEKSDDSFFPAEKTKIEPPKAENSIKATETEENADQARPTIWRRVFNVWTITILILLALAVVGFCFKSRIIGWFYHDQDSTSTSAVSTVTSVATTPTTDATTTTPASTVTETMPPATAPTATPSTVATPPAQTFTIEVLNGNGLPNAANNIKTILENAGYTVAKTGNARTSTYAKTYIYYKSTAQKVNADAIASVLSNREIVETRDSTIAKTYDIVVVVGKK